MARLSLSVLGPLQVSLDGQRVTGFESNKVRALLVYLAVEADRPHGRDVLAGLLWPDQPDQVAHDNLRQVLANLRHTIGDRTAQPPFLHISRESLQFNAASDHQLDAVTFITLLAACDQHVHRRLETCRSCAQRLQQAADLYRGDFLAQFMQSGSEAFEEWVLVKRERLHRAALDALYSLAEYHDRRAEYDQALRYALRQLELDPWREEAHRQVMRALALSGQRSAALAQYEACRRLLVDELGAEPSRETVTLHAKIKTDSLRSNVHHSNLPVPSTRLIGREQELKQLADLLENPACRLLTLTGPGGIGKTRLALQVAADHIGSFADGVWFVELAALSDPGLVPQAVASALDLIKQQIRPPLQVLQDYLRAKSALLVLDNCEHLIDACAQLAETLLRACPDLCILATSREALNIAGEVAWLVPALALPDLNARLPLQVLSQYDAIRLFTERAAAARPTFQLAEQNAVAVTQVCSRLDGIPLAIELAAARVPVLPVEQIAQRLDDRFRLLASGSRTALPRQQTLRSTIDWSYDLLSESEHVCLRRLSVFAGGWTLDAAAAVCTDGGVDTFAVLDMLTRLVNKSMVIAERGPREEARYRMLETIRQYAQEKLVEVGELVSMGGRHLDYFLRLAEEAEPKLYSAEQIDWLDRLAVELDNIRAALGRSAKGDNVEAGLRTAGALWQFWFVRGYLGEGRKWLEGLLSKTSGGEASSASVSLEVRAQAFSRAGYVVFLQGDTNRAKALAEAGVDLCRQLEDRAHLAYSLSILGMILGDQGAFDQARTLLAESLALSHQVGHKWYIACATYRLAVLEILCDNNELAETLLEEALSLYRELGDKKGVADIHLNLGFLARVRGDYEQAAALYRENLAQYRELDLKMGISWTLEDLGKLALEQGQYAQAATCLEESLALRQELDGIRAGASAILALGIVAWRQGDYARAGQMLEKNVALLSETGEKQDIGYTQHALGDLARSQRDYGRAAALYKEGLTRLQDIKGYRWGIAESLRRLGALAGDVGQPKHAARLLAVAEAIREAIGTPLPPVDQTDHERDVAAVRAQLSDLTFAAAWAEGQAMTLEQATAYALAIDDEQ